MTMVRADAGIESEAEVVDAEAFVRLVVSGFVSIAEAKGVSLAIEPGTRDELNVRAADLRLIVSNLLDNAVRYTRAGGAVSIKAERRGTDFVIEVIDSGCWNTGIRRAVSLRPLLPCGADGYRWHRARIGDCPDGGGS